MELYSIESGHGKRRLKYLHFLPRTRGVGMGLRFYITKRILYAFILLFFIIALNFIIFRLMPGDPIAMLLNPFEKTSIEDKIRQEEELKKQWGLNEPLHVQFAMYVRNLFTWNFGKSIVSRKPVSQEMLYKIPYTLTLLGTTTILAVIIGVLWGAYTAQKRGSLFDSFSVTSSLVFYSLPVFWLGLVFILIFFVNLGWLPHAHAFPTEWALGWPQPYKMTSSVSGGTLNILVSLNPGEILEFIGGYVSHAFLPILTLTIFQYGGFLLLTRAVMMETLTEDYVITARAKGLEERTVLFKHALKNASLPLITSAAISFGFILSGAIITETVFTWPGLGGWIWDAINLRNYTVLMAIFYVIAICVIVANLMADLLYGIIDPRIKYG